MPATGSRAPVPRRTCVRAISNMRWPARSRGPAENPSADLRRPCGPSSGLASALLAHASTDALAALLGASPESGPPGSPNLSPRVSGRASVTFDQAGQDRVDERGVLGGVARIDEVVGQLLGEWKLVGLDGRAVGTPRFDEPVGGAVVEAQFGRVGDDHGRARLGNAGARGPH